VRSRWLQHTELVAVWIGEDVPSPAILDDGLLSQYDGTEAGKPPDLTHDAADIRPAYPGLACTPLSTCLSHLCLPPDSRAPAG
jgi:hypothetical protein